MNSDDSELPDERKPREFSHSKPTVSELEQGKNLGFIAFFERYEKDEKSKKQKGQTSTKGSLSH